MPSLVVDQIMQQEVPSEVLMSSYRPRSSHYYHLRHVLCIRRHNDNIHRRIPFKLLASTLYFYLLHRYCALEHCNKNEIVVNYIFITPIALDSTFYILRGSALFYFYMEFGTSQFPISTLGATSDQRTPSMERDTDKVR